MRSRALSDEIMRALVVEDEEALRRNVAAHLREAGFTVDEAADGEEGLYYAREYSPDVAVVDLGLPRLEDRSRRGARGGPIGDRRRGRERAGRGE